MYVQDNEDFYPQQPGWAGLAGQKGVIPTPCPSSAERGGYGSTVCINMTSYADHSDKLKYRSLPDDQGWIIGA